MVFSWLLSRKLGNIYTMFADEIRHLLDKFPQVSKHLKYICAIDQLPKKLSELDAIVANTE